MRFPDGSFASDDEGSSVQGLLLEDTGENTVYPAGSSVRVVNAASLLERLDATDFNTADLTLDVTSEQAASIGPSGSWAISILQWTEVNDLQDG